MLSKRPIFNLFPAITLSNFIELKGPFDKPSSPWLHNA
jgi:hypothetical protein